MLTTIKRDYHPSLGRGGACSADVPSTRVPLQEGWLTLRCTRRLVVLSIAAALGGCSPEDGGANLAGNLGVDGRADDGADAGGADADDGADAGGGADGGASGVDGSRPEDPLLRECAAKGGGAVTSIADAVERLNALPHPVSAPCFVASLPRPLTIVATTETSSVQPAGGPHDPRVFLMMPGLVVAVVSSGSGARLLEFGEWVTPATTLKGEIRLPVTGALEASAPFAHLDEEKTGGVTSCGRCHYQEAAHPSVARGYVSAAFRPNTEMTVDALAAEHEACVAHDDASARCAMFRAIFEFGAVQQGAFGDQIQHFTE